MLFWNSAKCWNKLGYTCDKIYRDFHFEITNSANVFVYSVDYKAEITTLSQPRDLKCLQRKGFEFC